MTLSQQFETLLHDIRGEEPSLASCRDWCEALAERCRVLACEAEDVDGEWKQTLDMRDHFAASALNGICAIGGYLPVKASAKQAYALADAMLVAREAKP